jgi:hypothetical protein
MVSVSSLCEKAKAETRVEEKGRRASRASPTSRLYTSRIMPQSETSPLKACLPLQIQKTKKKQNGTVDGVDD